jgi:argininosuccinate synthase
LKDKVVLAYSGGVDTSVAIKWIGEKYGMDVIALSVDMGAEKEYEAIRQKALGVGAIKALIIDARDTFINDFVFPTLQADAIYEGQYTLATAIGRPLIARLLVDVARQEGATAVAHGCTGKGNDQVRFDVSVAALAPDLRIIAPAREWGMTREQAIEYARKHEIPIPVTRKSPYSIDENLWGKSIECGVLDDPWAEPPEEVFTWTKSPLHAPDEPRYVEIGFEKGIPVSLDGQAMAGVALVEKLNAIAGEHGVGRYDNLENRLVGIKSREVYETPAAAVLLAAHLALEQMTLSRDQFRFKQLVAQKYAELVYDGLWYTALHQDLDAYVKSTQRNATGVVRMKLYKGKAMLVGRKSPASLYSYGLATYDEADQFDHSAAAGFISIYGLPVKTQAQIQGLEQER